MPLETATYINELEPSNPASTDQLAQADEHFRLLKSVLQATFPNLTGPVTAVQADLNTPPFKLPIGIILNWYGESGTIPAGWALCNGQTVTRTDGGGNITTPDLRDRSVVGAGAGIAARGVAAGALSSSVNTGSAGDHAHSAEFGGSHTHTAVASTESPGGITVSTRSVDSSGTPVSVVSGVTQDPVAHGHTITIAADAGHEHTVSSGGAHQHSVSVSIIQPVFGLHFIMKV